MICGDNVSHIHNDMYDNYTTKHYVGDKCHNVCDNVYADIAHNICSYMYAGMHDDMCIDMYNGIYIIPWNDIHLP